MGSPSVGANPNQPKPTQNSGESAEVYGPKEAPQSGEFPIDESGSADQEQDTAKTKKNNARLDKFRKIFKLDVGMGLAGVNYGNSRDLENPDGKTRYQLGFGTRLDIGANGSVLDGRLILSLPTTFGFDTTQADGNNIRRNFYVGISPGFLLNLYRAEHKNDDASPLLVGASMFIGGNYNWSKDTAINNNTPIGSYSKGGFRFGGCLEVIPPYVYGLKAALCLDRVFQKVTAVDNPHASDSTGNNTTVSLLFGGSFGVPLRRKVPNGDPQRIFQITKKAMVHELSGYSTTELKTFEKAIDDILAQRGGIEANSASGDTVKPEKVEVKLDVKQTLKSIESAKEKSAQAVAANEAISDKLKQELNSKNPNVINKKLSKLEEKDLDVWLADVEGAKASLEGAKIALAAAEKDFAELEGNATDEQIAAAKTDIETAKENIKKSEESSLWVYSLRVVKQYKEVWNIENDVQALLEEFEGLQKLALAPILNDSGVVDSNHVRNRESSSFREYIEKNLKPAKKALLDNIATFNGKVEPLLEKYQNWLNSKNSQKKKIAAEFISDLKSAQEKINALIDGSKVTYGMLDQYLVVKENWTDTKALTKGIKRPYSSEDGVLKSRHYARTSEKDAKRLSENIRAMQSANNELSKLKSTFLKDCEEQCETLRSAGFLEVVDYSERILLYAKAYESENNLVNLMLDIVESKTGLRKAKSKEDITQLKAEAQTAFSDFNKALKLAKETVKEMPGENEKIISFKKKKINFFNLLYTSSLEFYQNVAAVYYNKVGNIRNKRRLESAVQKDVSNVLNPNLSKQETASVAASSEELSIHNPKIKTLNEKINELKTMDAELMGYQITLNEGRPLSNQEIKRFNQINDRNNGGMLDLLGEISRLLDGLDVVNLSSSDSTNFSSFQRGYVDIFEKYFKEEGGKIKSDVLDKLAKEIQAAKE